jgi:hypothetical protein
LSQPVSRREFLAASAIVSTGGFCPPLAQAQDKTDVWGRTILPQPHDAAPFREVKVPAWVQETTGVGYTL